MLLLIEPSNKATGIIHKVLAVAVDVTNSKQEYSRVHKGVQGLHLLFGFTVAKRRVRIREIRSKQD